MAKQEQIWKSYGFVARSKQRRLVIAQMDRPMTVTEIKRKVQLSLSETSRVLRRIEAEGLAKCLNPDDALGRVYQLTKKGKKIKNMMKI